jgi:CheY-like chemotaxis protein
VLVAVDLRPELDELRHALLDATASALANLPGARIACVNVMPASLIAIDEKFDSAGENVDVRRLAEFRRRARPLELPKGKITITCCNRATSGPESWSSPARTAPVIGVHGRDGSFLDRTGAQLTADAPCTVTVVCTAAPPGDRQEAPPVGEPRPQPQTGVSGGVKPMAKPHRVLVVDDEPNIVLSLRYLMTKGGYEVSAARDGEEALVEIARAVPDLVLLDVMLPKLDGLSLCEKIRANPAWEGMRIVMLTARDSDIERRKGLALGVDAYITKPFSTKEVLAHVANLLAHPRQNRRRVSV